MQKINNAETWNAWGETHPGKKRESNEDRILCDAERGFFVVVDGMGGEAAGEVAAQEAIDFIHKRLREETGSAARRLREAIAGANNEIYRLAEKNPQWRGMACVLTAALVENETLHIGHVGDSRLYKIRDDGISKVTPDHSPIGQREDSGELTELEAMRHPRRNEVFRDVGSQMHKPDDANFIEYLQAPFELDAAYVLCSDGLSDMLSSREILGVVLEHAGSPRDSVRELIEKANAAGGKDNVSVIVVEAGNFAAAAAKSRPRNGGGRPALIWGRWAFLTYGILAGFLLAHFWLRPPQSQSPAPETTAAVRLPSVLRVSPGSVEYPTIRSALDAARAGDRIEIADGEYEESVRLKDGIELSAQSPGKAVLRITQALPDADAAIIAEGVQGAAVAGLAVKAAPGAGLPFGVRVTNSSITVSNVEISGALGSGMLINGQSAGVVSAGYIHDNARFGIVVGGTATPLMTGNLIQANGKSRTQASPGLYVTENSNPEVRQNVFSNNGAEAIRVQRQELRERMMDNFFINSGRKPVMVERAPR